MPLLGQAKLSELLALGPNRTFDLLFPLTTVDGSREDDISITWKAGTGEDLRERGSFRSLFETEGCPAPFMLGSRFYCFHCPGMESHLMKVKKPEIILETQDYSGLQCSPAEMKSADRSTSQEDMEKEEKLALMFEKLRVEVRCSTVVPYVDVELLFRCFLFLKG